MGYLLYQTTPNYADVAQSVEHILGKDEVTSSNLVISSTKKDTYLWVPFLFCASAVGDTQKALCKHSAVDLKFARSAYIYFVHDAFTSQPSLHAIITAVRF